MITIKKIPDNLAIGCNACKISDANWNLVFRASGYNGGGRAIKLCETCAKELKDGL